MPLLSLFGIDQTFVIFFSISLVLIPVLYFFVMVPYFKILEGREEATVGGEEEALKVSENYESLHVDYVRKLKERTDFVKKIQGQLDQEFQDLWLSKLSELKEDREKKLKQLDEELRGQAVQLADVLLREQKTVLETLESKFIKR